MTYFAKALKNDFYSKTRFLPKMISLQNQVIKAENHIILIHANNFLTHSTSSKLNFFIINPFSQKLQNHRNSITTILSSTPKA